MKRKLLLMLSALSLSVYADRLSVEQLNVPKGGQATLQVHYQFDVENLYSGYQFSLTLPEGFETVKGSNGAPLFTIGDCYDQSYTFSSTNTQGTDNFVALSLQSVPMSGLSGTILSIPVKVTGSFEVGQRFEAKLSGIQFGNKNGVDTEYLDDVNFQITIVEEADPWILLDEKSTSLPESTEGATEIKVIRTIKANQWNTICLPFAMTANQVYEVFGTDVQLAEFMEYEINDEQSEINVIFDYALLNEDGFFANYPYIIKTSKDITEFIVTSTIEPDEENACAEYTNGKTGSRKEVYGTFYGTLKAGGEVPECNLFLNGGKFWYSLGQTEIMAFRGYFELDDIVASMDVSESRINVLLKDKATGVTNVVFDTASDKMYDLLGREIKKPVNGIYIRNGKKIIIK